MAGRGRVIPSHVLHLRDGQPTRLGPQPQIVHILDETSLLRRLPLPHAPPPSIIALEDRLAAQYREIQVLLSDNQHLAATHVALKQELDASRNELRVASAASARAQVERDAEVREVLERSLKADAEARVVEEMRAELTQGLKVELSRTREELGQASAMRDEIEAMNREIQRGRAAVEYEKKARAENLGQSQEMQKNMVSMAREVEKLRVELDNAEKRARASAAAAAAVAANPSLGYTDAYRNTGMVYGGNAYTAAYNLHQVQPTADVSNQYGQVASAHTGYINQSYATR
ncbi:protein FLC EXPRESSOR isoform X2 [Dendrobium catenatum]|uniref:protein FLC EXPRESSOR isoform X2 n=1 Tax=Dendrobium catenatum TaxID=906689 RepID=UPI0009F48D69|nr:protein FLC EXPRESSOR isoform X2 [Dendrobium catenatum]